MSKQELRAELGWLSHTTHCYQGLSGRENIELHANLYGISHRVIEPLLDRLQIGAFASKPVESLSRGQKQRIALARTLINDPALLLLDEPWTGLDKASSIQLKNILLQEHEHGKFIVIVSHKQGLADELDALQTEIIAGRLKSKPIARL